MDRSSGFEMRRFVLLPLLAFAVVATVDCNPDYPTCPDSKGFGNGTQYCGYVTVREGAHMFYWFYKSTAADSDSAPLMIWLSGGPGASSCGHGNFMSAGPLDEKKKEREYTWIKEFNVLFVDSPVGAGYSYVEHLKYLANDNKQIAIDMVNVTRAIFAQSRFETLSRGPLYIYGDGYGGKIAVDFTRQLIDDKVGNVKSLALGNVWASPIDSVMSYAPYLYEVSLVDEYQRDMVLDQANFTKTKFKDGDFYHATLEWIRTLDMIIDLTDGIDFGNILIKMPNTSYPDGVKPYYQTTLERMTYSRYYSNNNNNSEVFFNFMDGEVKDALKIPANVTWGKQSSNTFENLFVDFMKPVTPSIEYLLNTTNITIHVCNGNLDIMVDTPGQFHWINDLVWPDENAFQKAKKTTVWADGLLEGYQKKGGRLSFYWMNVAGVDFINENPKATAAFLKAMKTS